MKEIEWISSHRLGPEHKNGKWYLICFPYSGIKEGFWARARWHSGAWHDMNDDIIPDFRIEESRAFLNTPLPNVPEKIPQELKWTRLEDEIPLPNQRVLVYGTKRGIEIMLTSYFQDEIMKSKVGLTHWMPLPDRPE